MTANQLNKIKQYQREYMELFGEKLHIDWLSMKQMKAEYTIVDEKKDPEKMYRECLSKHNASHEKIISGKRLDDTSMEKERAAIREFCKDVIFYRIAKKEAARIINRDRTMIYYYAFEM